MQQTFSKCKIFKNYLQYSHSHKKSKFNIRFLKHNKFLNTRHLMNQLPIVVLSKELKYSLINDKAKTLEKAIDLLQRLPQNQENKRKNIQALAQKYSKIKLLVSREYKNLGQEQLQEDMVIGGSTQSLRVNNIEVPEIYRFLLSKCSCEIYGPKGSGKTSLLLHFAEIYAQTYKHERDLRIVLYSCASGMTPKRLQVLESLAEQGIQIQCLEIGSMEELKKSIATLQNNPPKHLFIGIDMFTFFLLPQEKPKIQLSSLFLILSQLILRNNATVVYTNFVQHKYEVGTEQLYNHASYYCQSTGEYTTHKIYLQRPDKSQKKENKDSNKFRLKGVKGFTKQAFFSITQLGIKGPLDFQK